MKKDLTEKERVQINADLIAQIFTEIQLLDVSLLNRALELSKKRYTMATSGAAIVQAAGMDSTEKEMEALLYIDRIKALINLIDTLKDTEARRQEFFQDKEKKQEGRDQLSKFFGEA